MKTTKIIYWVSTILIVLFEGVMPALTFNTELAKQGISHLGYPAYFGLALTVFKIIGSLILIIPALKGRIKEWAYAGFTFDFLFATISHIAVDGFSLMGLFPIAVLIVLAVSYFTYHKLYSQHRSAL